MRRSEEQNLIKSPLNYTGGKYKLLEQIVPIFPEKISKFVDLFCGGCNVGINVIADKIECIDNQKNIIRLYNIFKLNNEQKILDIVLDIIEKYRLSLVSKNGYNYYDSEGGKGLADYNKEKFISLRGDYNKRNKDELYYDIMFYVILVYAFNNQIRFNKGGNYNVPVGKRDFNSSIEENLKMFIKRIHTLNIDFINDDFRNYNINNLTENDFVYADPPYLITTAAYNEQGGWNEQLEMELLNLLDNLNKKKVKFALSNVLESNGKENIILKEWSKKYNIHMLDFTYKNSNYQKKQENRNNKIKEVLITNY
ncbi:MAG TPA: DNA methyltransferase [Clostridiales bacterium]|nr:DNA methyltransferase [Clostridiales bacterium]